jgi:ATP-dependent Lhr-like helicase
MKGQDRGTPRDSLPDSLSAKFRSLGFDSLTEIQRRAVPVIYQKKDSLVIAPTGSGKTECSVIPIFERVGRSKKPGRIKVLYVTPLRALNRDVFRRIIRYAQSDGLSIEIRHGDTTRAARRRITLNPPDVLITTPETLVILLTQKAALEALSELEWVVIDEVHELLSSERGAQLSLSLERLQLNARSEMTRVGLSATVGDALRASKFVVGTKRRCRVIRDTSLRRYDVEVRYVDGTISDVAEAIVDYVEGLKLDSQVLLFTNTRGEAEFLASILREKSDAGIELHHGSLSRDVREETESVLREGRRGIVVCTSSLELGLDIGSIEFVIHYGSPRQVSKMVQRIGRSKHSRRSSARGLVITNSADDEFEAKAILERIREGSMEDQVIHDGSLDVLAHHLVGLTMQCGEVEVGEALGIFARAYPFRSLTLEDVVSVLELLDANYLVFFDRQNARFRRKGRAFRYYFENLSTIPNILKFRVFDSVGKRIIGTLDQRFVGDHGESGNVFVLRGTQWRILNVDEKSLAVNVEPFRGGSTTVPYWEGESIPVDRHTARKVGAFRTRVGQDPGLVRNSVVSRLQIPRIPDERVMVAESSRPKGILVLHACLGSRINSTISTLLSSMLSSLLGVVVEARADAYRISLSSVARITEALLRDVLCDEYDLYSVISASLADTHNVTWRTWCVAKKFGVVGREAVYDKRQARFLYHRYLGTPMVKEALRELYHDKYDLPGTEQALADIRQGRIQLAWTEVDDFSQLAEPILDHTAKYYSSPSSLDQGILDLIKNRLSKTRHRLVCCRCGKWEMAVQTCDVKGALACPYCRGRQITATFYSDYDLPGIIRRKHAGKRLSAEEAHKFDRAWKVSSLVESFGSTAILVMSGYGVGADTAARILRDMVDEETLYRQIYQAERQYVMTRGFWD